MTARWMPEDTDTIPRDRPWLRENAQKQRDAARPRAIEIAVLWYGGCTLQEIATEIGVSRERVRQIVRKVVPEGTRPRRFVDLNAAVGRWNKRSPAKNENEREALRALGFGNPVALRRDERRARRATILATVERLGKQLHRSPVYHEVATAVLGRPIPRMQAAPLLLGHLGVNRYRRASRLLAAIWTRAGFPTRGRGSNGHVSGNRRSITSDELAVMRRMRASGFTYRAIGIATGRSESGVAMRLAGVTP